MKNISLVVVEDHQLVREMWTSLFVDNPEIEVVGECGGFDEAIEMIKDKKPDIVLLDINLPGASGMDAVPLIRKFSPSTRIIAVSMHNQPVYAKKMLQMGAKGYVTKNSSPQEMLESIAEVMKGKTFVCAEIKNSLFDQLLEEKVDGPDVKDLSIREIEIIKLIVKGLSSKEIAANLQIAVRTVEVHRHNILQKLGVKNTASLINFINTTDLSFQ